MPPKRNPLTEVGITILSEIAAYQKRAMKAKPIPLGMEKVRASTARDRIADMTFEQRTKMLEDLGPVEAARRLENARL